MVFLHIAHLVSILIQITSASEVMEILITSASEVMEGGRSPVTCSTNNTACDNSYINQIDVIGHVSSIQECRKLCYDSNECEYLTYYGVNSFPFSEVCFLLRECSGTHLCTECVSETRNCYYTCGRNLVGKIDENLVEVFSGVESEFECKELCYNSSSDCKYYTYFLKEDPNSQTCVLLSSLKEPLQPCDHCVTGPVICDKYQDCSFIIDDEQEQHQFFMFNKTDVEINIYIPRSFGSSECQLRVFAIGGGGGGSFGGGGSGYHQYLTKDLSGPTTMRLTVGDHGNSSTVSVNGETIIAEPGNVGRFGDGGNGYSGGGGCCDYCSGGSSGEDGASGVNSWTDAFYRGGHGTGEDLKAIILDNFVLSPGNGGKPSVYEYGGGGGGGVLINGGGWNGGIYSGEGYGGGGGDEYGGPGAILVEIIN